MRRCMQPNDHLADREHARAVQAIQRGNVMGAAWHETAAAHLTSSRRPRVRGTRAFQACTWWQLAGRYDWAAHMAQAFLHDRCISRHNKRLLRTIAGGGVPEALGEIGDMGALALICGLFIGLPALVGILGSAARR